MRATLLFRVLLLVALAFFTFLMVRLTLPYTAMSSDVDFLKSKQAIYHLPWWRDSFYLHVFTSCLVLIAGFTQFNPWLLRRYRRVHRWMGWVYLVTVTLISGPAGFVMGWYANGGLPARTSFILLSVLWVTLTLYAGYYAVRKKFQLHGAFMFRSYALTLSAITLRAYTWLFAVAQVHASSKEIYITTTWLSWVPNLILAEILIRKGFVERVYSETRRLG
ncbi:MAG: DUF2306 domain-containing protein [Bacteroidetes bacterium]|nr:DUF2306 domain-containing protein [Bacteroidota bacterium]